MVKARAAETNLTVRDSKTGRFVTVRGAGALKGQLSLIKGIDLTKPIAAQADKHSGPSGAAGRSKR